MARVILRDLVNATVDFEGLARETEKPSKSLHRMPSANGNPSMDNLAAIFAVIRTTLSVHIEVHSVPLSRTASPSRQGCYAFPEHLRQTTYKVLRPFTAARAFTYAGRSG